MTRGFLGYLFFIVLIINRSIASAQSPPVNSIGLTKPLPIRRGVAAMPLIRDPKAIEQQRINNGLKKVDASLRSTLAECDKDYSDLLEMRTPKSTGTKKHGDWKRTVIVTMAGPRYLSYLISDFNYCGGAHANFSESALVYDLQTGSPVNWVAMLLHEQVKLQPEDDWNGIPAQQISAKSIQAFYAAHLADSECKKIVAGDEDVSLLVWLDAKYSRVMLGTNLRHVIEACAEHVAVSAQDARRLGFSEEFLRTIKAN